MFVAPASVAILVLIAALLGVAVGALLCSRERVRVRVVRATDRERVETTTTVYLPTPIDPALTSLLIQHGRQIQHHEMTAVPSWRVVAVDATTRKTLRTSPLVPYVSALVIANGIKCEGVQVELVHEEKAE